MSLSVLLLLLLLVCSVQADFYGLVVNYYPNSNGYFTGTLRYKLSDSSCIYSEPYTIAGDSIVLNKVDEESNGGPCQTEGILTQLFTSNSIVPIPVSGLNWISGIKNGIVSFTAEAVVDLSIRSDTSSANTSPQTTIIPAVRVPSNCARNFNLLTFDPDGDVVKCRNGNTSLFECAPCTPPSVLSLSPSSCTLSFSPTNSSNEGPYAVQLMMEDFPRETITLTQTDGTQTTITTNDAIGKIPVQFVLIVDPAVPSCTEGLFLPMFLPPTPAHGYQFFTNVNETLQITISAQALNSTISELLFSGPYTVTKTQTGPGQFTLTWTPPVTVAGQSHPVCFVVQATFGPSKYQSELRCVIVSIGNALTTPSPTTPPFTSAMTPDSSTAIRPINATTIRPTNATAIRPINSTTIRPTNATAIRPINSTTIRPTNATTIRPTNATTIRPTNATTIRPTNATTIRPTNATTIPTFIATMPPINSTTIPTFIATIPPINSTITPPFTATTPPISTSEYVAGLKMKLTSLVDLSQIDQDALLNQMKQVLESYGLPEGITLRIRSIHSQIGATAAPANATR